MFNPSYPRSFFDALRSHTEAGWIDWMSGRDLAVALRKHGLRNVDGGIINRMIGTFETGVTQYERRQVGRFWHYRPRDGSRRLPYTLAMTPDLPPGDYPFAYERHPLADLQMAEAPADMQDLFVASARQAGIEIVRDAVVELRCEMPGGDVATFAVWWPAGEVRMHMLVPKKHVRGTA